MANKVLISSTYLPIELMLPSLASPSAFPVQYPVLFIAFEQVHCLEVETL